MFIPVWTTAFAIFPKFGTHEREAMGASGSPSSIKPRADDIGSDRTPSCCDRDGARELDGVGSGVEANEADSEVDIDGIGVDRSISASRDDISGSESKDTSDREVEKLSTDAVVFTDADDPWRILVRVPP